MPANDPKRFANQVILITGASSGIGMAAAKAFAREGASLMLAARRLDRLNGVAADCRALGARCDVMAADVQERAQVLRLVDQTLQKFGRMDVLVNNAGMGHFGAFHLQPWEVVERTLRTNVEGALALCHAVLPQMIRQRSGVILIVSSVVGKRPVPMLAAYCASKFALWGFSQSLASELRPHGISVCHFCPAATATEFHHLAGMEPAGGPPGRMASADRVAAGMVEAVIQRKPEYIMSATERGLIKLHLLAPRLTGRLLDLVRKS